ncbi:GntR family transcriptional regulator [Gordonia hydrophobica]|uniref:GntR family transcriptional regulator n=1 Tax=Gordonia hydrophobica TaxID=40516 RepID=A0ABZ2U614_9ACTN|nr:GntR family transcriptional regulator [Gordonia hydrophobica]MBM7368693.1 DNA-binding GntR family transcriptional regulator [Gordonia hydrophobica]
MEATSATRRAYDAILAKILNGAHAPGTLLSEVVLGAEIGCSRTPVRTALALLQDEGWIRILPKRGALVTGLNEAQIADLAEARWVLETTAVQVPGQRPPSKSDGAMREVIAEHRAALADRDLPRFVESTIAFHRGFVEAGGNEVLLELYDRLADRQRFLLYSHGTRLLERSADIIAEHEALNDRFQTSDREAFGGLLHHHLVRTYDTTVHVVDGRTERPEA